MMLNEIQILQLLANDYVFFTIVAALFFFFGILCANDYNKHRYQEHFWRHLESRRKLLEQVRMLEQKQ